METQIFFAVLAFTLIYSVTEATHDYYVIKNDVGYTHYSKMWHWWGMIQNAIAFAPVIIALFIWDYRLACPLSLIAVLLFWQLHDSIIGWKLYRRPFYLSNKGFDRFLDEVFQGGVSVFVIRMMFILTSAFDYFRNI
jgi:hypothetical protein